MGRVPLVIGSLLAGVLAAPAHAAARAYVVDAPRSRIAVEGRSTLHGFTARSIALSGALDYDRGQDALAGPATIRLPVRSLETGIGARDRAMWRMFDAERYPEIVVTITAIRRGDGPPDARGRLPYHLSGHAQVRDVTQPIDADAWASVAEDAIEVEGELALTTTQFGLRPPVALGVVRVRPPLRARFAIQWIAQP
jgi:polyisoprenoid-binding protein YceI